MKQLKRLMSFLLVLCLSFGMIPGALAAGSNSGNPFTDVASTDWFYSAVQYAYGKGIMSGTSANKFSPDVTTTRGMVVTMLHRMEGTPVAYGANFVDVGRSQYYTDAVAWASANGIVSGYSNGNFGADDVITREQMASVLYRYSEYRNLDTKSTAVLSGFSDADQVNSYAVNAMAWAVGNGLISGNGHNQLAPQASASRAEIASVLMRYDQTFAVEPEEQSNNDDAADTAAETFTVTFDLNYGSSGTYRTVKVQSGDTVKFPSEPSRTGYDFDGWYSDSSCKEKFDSKTPITEDITLYAAWDKSTSGSSGSSSSSGSSYGDGGMKGHDGYGGQGSSNHGALIPVLPGNTVSFNLNYSNPTETIPTQQVEEGGHAIPPADPQRAGYAFLGWYYGSTFYSFANETVTHPITLTAEWFNLSDTTSDDDSDGLTNYQEIITFSMAYDPNKADSDDDGVSDADEDFDGDDLTNAAEIALGTNPAEADSDHDGLTDGEEVNVYGTDPNDPDSDGDGVSDGQEVALGTDPMTSATTFDASNFGPANGPKFSMKNLTADQAESLTIQEVHDELLFPDTLPCALSSAYDFTMVDSSSLTGATIEFEFDPTQASDPVIYYFDEETQQLKELPTTVDRIRNVAYATVTHFSKYILIDRIQFRSVQEWEDEFDLSDSQFESVQAVMVIDDSGSMTSNDRNNKRLEVAKDLIDRLPKNSEVSVIQFASNDKNLTNGFTADKDNATQYLTRTYFRSSGNTYMYTAIDHTIDLFSGTVYSLSDDEEDVQLAEEELDDEVLTAEDDSESVELLENRANAELSEDADEIITDDGEDADEGETTDEDETADDSEDADEDEIIDDSETADEDETADDSEDADEDETADDSETADDGELYTTADDLLDEDDDFFASLYEDTTPPTPRDSNDKVLKIVIVLSDGAAQDTSKHSSVVSKAISQNIRIYTVGLGSSTTYFDRYLKPLADDTNGKFYRAADASQLADIYKDIGKVIDLKTDTDGDGIPDYYEDNLPLFNGTKLKLDKNGSDTDGDGVPDGDEVKLQVIEGTDENGKPKVWVVGRIISNPCDPDDPNPRYFERLNRDTTLGLTAEQKQTMVTMGNTMLEEGFELPFIAGVLGNIYFEGTAGRFESSAYADPSRMPDYLKQMEANFDYRNKYSGKNITEVSLQDVKAMVDALDSSGYTNGEFGLGCIQWHGKRTKALVDIYVDIAGGASITTEQVLEAEGRMIGKEMSSTHSYVYDTWKNSSVRDANTAGQIICQLYEVPANWQQKMYEHGNFAELIYSVMTDANANP